MAILEALEQRAGNYLKETQQLIWKCVSEHLSASGAIVKDRGKGSDRFLELQPTQEVELPSVNVKGVVAGQSSKPSQKPLSLAPLSASKAGKKKHIPVVAEDEDEQEMDELEDSDDGQLDGEDRCMPPSAANDV
ncbi:hypothetical protein FOMPIDRAFT_1055324 [Fomitopsis schrenkii]|uniref:Uncharacterized protein n=1 Tax=Fomitopsis schrenkii TaxID=2126942 RepID=S8F5N6_FOMSC|nr:hypothetical protein FOMPIDRAFT_1055324 [Fomitopsis schrenkii]